MIRGKDKERNCATGDPLSDIRLILKEIEREETPARLLELATRLQDAMKRRRSTPENEDSGL